MVKCKICNGNCDPGEVVGGVCMECAEEEQQRQIRAAFVARMINSPFRQMELRLESVYENCEVED